MTLESQLYISEFIGCAANRKSLVAELVTCSTEKNTSLHITGGLIFTGQHFAQILEGDPKKLDALMVSIERDPRHKVLKVFDRKEIKVQRFPYWGLAYAGPSNFVSDHITRLLASTQQASSKRDENSLTELIVEFAIAAP